jgi:hypothetical protein
LLLILIKKLLLLPLLKRQFQISMPVSSIFILQRRLPSSLAQVSESILRGEKHFDTKWRDEYNRLFRNVGSVEKGKWRICDVESLLKTWECAGNEKWIINLVNNFSSLWHPKYPLKGKYPENDFN